MSTKVETVNIPAYLYEALCAFVGDAYERADAAGEDDHEPARFAALAVLFLATDRGVVGERRDALLAIHERLASLATAEVDEPLETDAEREVQSLRAAAERIACTEE